MQKILLVILLCISADFPAALADNPVALDDLDNGGLVDLNATDIQNRLKTGEAFLKKFKVQQESQEEKMHIQTTQQAYQEGIVLYRQRRMGLAREALSTTDHLMDGYKSTDPILKKIDRQTLEKSKRETAIKKLINDPQMAGEFADKAAALEQQVAALDGDEKTNKVRRKLASLKAAMERLRRISPSDIKQLYIQEYLNDLSQQAENFDRQIYKLTKANDLAGARKKYEEFQQTMIEDFTKLKQTMGE